MLFFTSDWHLGHQRIIELCDRPFEDVSHMHKELVKRHNNLVGQSDDVFVLGDVAMGVFLESIKIVGKFNGTRIMLPGNHDRLSGHESESRKNKFRSAYEDVFDYVEEDGFAQAEISGIDGENFVVNMSHFPYSGDSHDKDRYEDLRPFDDGAILLHGHTHSPQKVSRSPRGSLQISVGVDSWDYRPASEHEIVQLIKENL